MAHATGKGSRARRAAAPNLLLAWDLDTEAIHAILRPGARIEIDPETRAVTVTVAERP